MIQSSMTDDVLSLDLAPKIFDRRGGLRSIAHVGMMTRNLGDVDW